MDTTKKSAVTELRERIAREYEAANRVFTDFTPNARHEFIIKRQENSAACFEDLQHYLDPEDAIELIIQGIRFKAGLSHQGMPFYKGRI